MTVRKNKYILYYSVSIVQTFLGGSLAVSMKIKSHTFDSVILCLAKYTWAHAYPIIVSNGEILE